MRLLQPICEPRTPERYLIITDIKRHRVAKSFQHPKSLSSIFVAPTCDPMGGLFMRYAADWLWESHWKVLLEMWLSDREEILIVELVTINKTSILLEGRQCCRKTPTRMEEMRIDKRVWIDL
jgi:hypothetical protein